MASDDFTTLPEPWADIPVTVVMPTYNEIGSLESTCEGVLSLPLPRLHLKVVDDNSPDGTGKLAEELAERANSGTDGNAKRMSVLHRPEKDGLGLAYAEGMAQAVSEGADYILQMDADGSHPAGAVPVMLGVALSAGCGVVVGSRYVSGGLLGEGWPAHRRLLSAWANWYVARVLGLGLRDITSGFTLWRRRHPARSRPRPDHKFRLQLPGGSQVPGAPCRAYGDRGADHVRSAPGRCIQDESGRAAGIGGAPLAAA